MLAGISAEYYVRLERGNLRGASDDVIDGIARALQLDEAERLHLFDLARALGGEQHRRAIRRPAQERVRPTVQRILDALDAVPAFVSNHRGDVLAANPLGRALYSPLFADGRQSVNTARFIFLNPDARQFFIDWETVANDSIGILRGAAGHDPFDRRLSDLIGELSTRSDEFRVRWGAHDVTLHRSGAKRIHHPIVGDLTLDFEALELPNDPGQRLVTYTTEPGSPSQHALALLASWAATPAAIAATDT